MKKIVLIALLFALSYSAYSQAVIGGAGICSVDQDPDNITDMQTQDERYECLIAVNETTGEMWVYDGGETLGSRWNKPPAGESTTVTDGTTIDLTLSTFDLTAEVINGTITPAKLDRSYIETEVDGVIGNEYNTGSSYIAASGIVRITDGGGNRDIPISVYNGADGSNPGVRGLIPDALATDNVKYLRGDGLWATPPADGDADNTNEAQTLSISSVAGVSVTRVLSQANGSGGGTAIDAAGNGMAINTTGTTSTFENTEYGKGAYKNHSDAAANSVAIGEYYYASTDNTMGLAPGAKVRRMF